MENASTFSHQSEVHKLNEDPERTSVDIPWNVSNFHYADVLHLMVEESSYFGFVLPNSGDRISGSVSNVLEALSSRLLSSSSQRQWPGGRSERSVTVNRYRSDDSSIGMLLHFASSFWDWDLPILPQDLHFMRRDLSIVVATTVNEHYTWTTGTVDETAALRERFPQGQLIGIFDPIDDMNRWFDAYGGDLEWSGSVTFTGIGENTEGSQSIAISSQNQVYTVSVTRGGLVDIVRSSGGVEIKESHLAKSSHDMDAVLGHFLELVMSDF